VLQAVTRGTVKVNEILPEFVKPEKPKPKESKPKRSKADPNDIDDAEFDSQEDAIAFAKQRFDFNLRKRPDAIAPEDILINGQNPSRDIIRQRKWGLNKISKVRMLPTIDNKWVVYWRPSLFENV
jgi:hypothetical protein